MRIDRNLITFISAVAGLFWLGWIIWILFRAPWVAPHEDVLADFAPFYAGAYVLAEGRAMELYLPDTLPNAIDAVVPWSRETPFPAVYPAHVYAAFRPILVLPLVPAAVSFGVVSMLLYAAAVRVMESGGPQTWPLRWLALGSVSLLYVIPAGQLSVIPLLQLALTWRAWRVNRMGLAGLMLGSLAWKPQLLLIGALALLVRPSVPLFAGLVAGAGLHAILFTSVVGIQGWVQYAAVLRQMSTADSIFFSTWRLQSLKGALDLLLPSGPTLWAVLAVATSVVLFLCRWLARRSDARTGFAIIVIGGLLVSPHVYAYDGLLVLAALYVIGEQALARGRATPSDLWAYVLYWSPALIESGEVTRIQPVCVAMLGWLITGVIASRAHGPAVARQ